MIRTALRTLAVLSLVVGVVVYAQYTTTPPVQRPIPLPDGRNTFPVIVNSNGVVTFPTNVQFTIEGGSNLLFNAEQVVSGVFESNRFGNIKAGLIYSSNNITLNHGGVITPYTQLSNALSALQAGDILNVGVGTYRLHTSTTMPEGSTIVGYNGATILWTNFTDLTANSGNCIVPSDNCSIFNLKMVNTDNQDVACVLIGRATGSCTNVLISGCDLEGLIDATIWTTTSKVQVRTENTKYVGSYDLNVIAPTTHTTNGNFDLDYHNCYFVWDDKTSGTAQALYGLGGSGRVRFFGCKFDNQSQNDLDLVQLDQCTNLTVEFFDCYANQAFRGTSTGWDTSKNHLNIYGGNLYCDCNIASYNGTNMMRAGLGIVTGGSSQMTNVVIYHTNGTVSIDSEHGFLADSALMLSVDFAQRQLSDSSSRLSADYQNRQLLATSGDPSVDWQSLSLNGDWSIDNGGSTNKFSGQTNLLTTSYAQAGTNAVTLTRAGTYLLTGSATFYHHNGEYDAGTYIQLALQRTNNTPALIGAVRNIDLNLIATTALTEVGIPTCPVPSLIYTTTNTTDRIAIYARLSAAPSGGTYPSYTDCDVVAIRLH